MPDVKKPYDNSRRQAQVRATRLRIIEVAKALFIEHGYPGTTLEAIAADADTSLPTLYRLFSSKRALLKAILDVSFGGDAALAEQDPAALVRAFARIGSDFMIRSSAIMHVLATAAQVDQDAAQLLLEIRRQRHVGQSRIVAAIAALDALDPDLPYAEATDMAYLAMSPDVHRILTVERGWTGQQYEQWLARSLGLLLRPGSARVSPRSRAAPDRRQ
jgi:AcrR family transcriptional regulator